MYVSKHHYAIELAKKGNEVYFLEPPVTSEKPFVKIRPINSIPTLCLIQYSPIFNLNLRFHFRMLFDRLMHRQVSKVLRTLNQSIDIVWCFESNLYSNLSWFRAKTNIYHVVDPVYNKYQIEVANSANVVIAVSEKILFSFINTKTPRFFINHGIAGAYFQSAKDLLATIDHYNTSEIIKVGYVGNLLRGPVNFKLISQLIVANPSINFHFWGSDDLKPGTPAESVAFISFLKSRPNVFLHGQRPPEELVEDIKNMDAFILAYVFIEGESDRSNSHKILEYLSTGKVVISSFVETYKNNDPLICMSKETDDGEFPLLFNKIINDLQNYNNVTLQKKRIQLVLENSYINHINKIENLLKNL
jgi:glycosyltransferase involved in cell wall biosynthesis